MINKKIASELAVGTILILALVIGGIFWMKDKNPVNSNQSLVIENSQIQNVNKEEKKDDVACTQEAKLCEDGSSVGRTGPNCEFAECPVTSKELSLNTYTNEGLGFSIGIPNIATIVEHGNIVYIINKNIEESNPGGSEDLQKKLKISGDEFAKVNGVPWAILVKDVKDKVELQNFIQNRYGKKCKIGNMKLSKQGGTFDVEIDKSNWDPNLEDNCFLNWTLHIKYNPELGKVAAWDIGQDQSFPGFDSSMADTFTFIK